MISKSVWTTDGDNVLLSMPIIKVDKENRLVTGWATLDNPDTQGDIVLAEASREAFNRFRGNIREMHAKKAVGRMVDFYEDTYYDTKTEKFYNGIVVTAYVSKGAEDTWEKCLDGTLSGFSIMGPIHKSEPTIKKNEDGSLSRLRIIKSYDLMELSLVDSPANQFANVLSIVKMANGETILKGMAAETRAENVFWCATEEIAKTSPDDAADCASCGTEMANIGWFEYDSSESTTEKVRSVLDAYLSSSEGGNDMSKTDETVEKAAADEVVADETTEEQDAVEKAADVDETATEEVAEETEVEKAADVSEVEVAEVTNEQVVAAIEKMSADLASAIDAVAKASTELASKLDETNERFSKAIDDLATGQKELAKKFGEVSDNVDALEKRVDSTDAELAVKKSGDLGGEPGETLAKSKGNKWSGAFLNSSDL